jgi:hypothetical protein
MTRFWMAALLAAVMLFPGAAAHAMSPEEGKRASEKLDRIFNDQMEPAEKIELTDVELNSYLHYEAPEDVPDGVRGLRIRFEPDLAVVNAFVDFSKLADSIDAPGGMFLRLLRGERQVAARCRYLSSAGQARVEVISFQVDGKEMKGPVLDWMIDNVIAPRLGDVPIGKPAPLGHNLEEVKLQSGKALIVAQQQIAAR